MGEVNNLKPMLLLFLSQRCCQAIKIIFKFPSQFVFCFPYVFDYFVFHLTFSHEFLRSADLRTVMVIQHTKFTDTWFHLGVINVFEIPSHKIIDSMNSRERDMKRIIYSFFR